MGLARFSNAYALVYFGLNGLNVGPESNASRILFWLTSILAASSRILAFSSIAPSHTLSSADTCHRSHT